MAAVGLFTAIVAVVYMLRDGRDETTNGYADIHLKCRSCGREVQIPASEYYRLRANDAKKKLPCDGCGKIAAEAMMQCPNCRRWYLPKADDAARRHVCPHCGYDAETG